MQYNNSHKHNKIASTSKPTQNEPNNILLYSFLNRKTKRKNHKIKNSTKLLIVISPEFEKSNHSANIDKNTTTISLPTNSEHPKDNQNSIVSHQRTFNEYSRDIYDSLKTSENTNTFNYKNDDLFRLQDFNNCKKVRKNIIQLISEIHSNLKIDINSLFMAVNIFDNYIGKIKCNIDELQLIAISSLYIASKYEETKPIDYEILLTKTNFLYNKNQFFDMEYNILSVLEFDLLYSSSIIFLSYFFYNLENPNKKILILAQFFLELSLLDTETLKFEQSLRAASALYMSLKCLKVTFNISNFFKISDFTSNDIENCCEKICLELKECFNKKSSNAIINKYRQNTVLMECNVFEFIGSAQKNNYKGLFF